MAPQSCALAALLLAACLLAAQAAAADTGCGCPLCGASFDVPAKQTLAAAAAHTISAPQAGSSPTQHENSGRWKEAQQMRTVGGQGPHLLRTSSKLHY